MPRNPSIVRAVLAVCAVGSCTILSIIGATPSANAATYPPTISSTRSGASPEFSSSGPSVISCSAKANNPHDSSHVGGTVNFVGSVTCSSPVASIRMTLTLLWDGYEQAAKTNGNSGQATLSNNVAAPCSSGGWQGSVVGTVVMPPGYLPQSGTVSASSVVSISC